MRILGRNHFLLRPVTQTKHSATNDDGDEGENRTRCLFISSILKVAISVYSPPSGFPVELIGNF